MHVAGGLSCSERNGLASTGCQHLSQCVKVTFSSRCVKVAHLSRMNVRLRI